MPTTHDVADALAAVRTQTEWYAKHGRIVNGMATGLEVIDETTWGLQPRAMSAIVGQAGSAKTSLALTVATWMVTRDNRRALWVSLHEEADQVARNLIAQYALIEEEKMRTGALSPSERQRIGEAVETFTHRPPLDPSIHPPLIQLDELPPPLQIMAGHDTQLADIVSCARSIPDLDVVFIDGLARLVDNHDGDGTPGATRDLVNRLDDLARTLDVHIMTTLHTDQPTDRTDMRPQLSDLREHRAILPTTTLVMALYRDEQHDDGTTHRGILDVEFLRNGNGNGLTRVIHLAFLPDMRKVANLAKVGYPRRRRRS